MDKTDELPTTDEGEQIIRKFQEWTAQMCLDHDLDPLEVWGLIGAYCEGSIFETVGYAESDS